MVLSDKGETMVSRFHVKNYYSKPLRNENHQYFIICKCLVNRRRFVHAICAVNTIYLQKGAKDTKMILKLMFQKQIENVMAKHVKQRKN